MHDICNFLPSKCVSSKIKYYHYVYEMSLKRLKQPFIRNQYTAHIVYRGNGKFVYEDKEYALSHGTLFFSFPGDKYNLEGDNSFSYLYITFNGVGVLPLLSKFGVDYENRVFYGLEELSKFWMDSIKRITAVNSSLLTESVLLYTLSYISTENNNDVTSCRKDRISEIIEFIDNNFSDKDLTMIKVADMFGYDKKYLSSIFKKHKGVKFTDYVNGLRLKKGRELILCTDLSVAQVAGECGFTDPFYFSKVFKKMIGKTPTEYRKKIT